MEWQRLLGGRIAAHPDGDVLEPVMKASARTEQLIMRLCGVVWEESLSVLRACPSGLPDPFEPLLAVYERGGSFGRDAGSIRIGPGDGVPARAPETYARRAPEEDLGPAALDALDRSWEARRDEAARRVREADQRRQG